MLIKRLDTFYRLRAEQPGALEGWLFGLAEVRLQRKGGGAESGPDFLLRFECDDAPVRLVPGLHRLLHRLNRKDQHALGTLACGQLLSGRFSTYWVLNRAGKHVKHVVGN